MQLNTGCDASAHILWGSTDINPQEEYLIEYLVSQKFNILNEGNRTTFAISKWKEVTDLRPNTE